MRTFTALFLIAIFGLTGCAFADPNASSRPPRSTITPTTLMVVSPELDMYQAVATKFFKRDELATIRDPHIMTRPVIYIEPTFHDTGALIPDAIHELLKEHAENLGLSLTDEEQTGGLVLAVSGPFYTKPGKATGITKGPLVSFTMYVLGNECDTYVDIGYLLKTDSVGWKASVYKNTEC